MTPKVGDLQKLQKGDPIDLYLVVNLDDTLGPRTIPVATGAIYYGTKAEAQANIEWSPSTGTGLRTVKLTLPPNAKEAFAAASTGAVRPRSAARSSKRQSGSAWLMPHPPARWRDASARIPDRG